MQCPKCGTLMFLPNASNGLLEPLCLTCDITSGPIIEIDPAKGTARYFDTGATRDTAEGKLDIHRFLSPEVLRRYCQYLESHRQQSDGKLRDPDNWKRGMPLSVYMASMTRHFWEVWEQYHTGERGEVDDDALCALMFNVMGFLYENMAVRRGEGE